MSSPKHRAEAGSAYVLVLLSLVVLTTLGLALASVTTTEMQIGQSERVITRAFYATEGGIALATARALNAAIYGSQQFSVRHEQWDGANSQKVNRGFRIDTSPFFPLRSQPCDWCIVNETGTGDYEQKYAETNFGVTVTANELTWTDDEEIPPADASIQSQKTIATMFDIFPVVENWDSLPQDQAELNKLKF
jgi:hypothetical protein